MHPQLIKKLKKPGNLNTEPRILFPNNIVCRILFLSAVLILTGCEDDSNGSSVNSGPFGCTDPAACNYDPDAAEDDGSCIMPAPYWMDSDSDGWGAGVHELLCPEDVTPGKVDNNSDNCPGDYNPDQRDSDGDRIGDVCDETLNGCTDPTALNYNPDAEEDDNSCYDDPYFASDIQWTGSWHEIEFEEDLSGLIWGDEIGVYDDEGILTSGGCDEVFGSILTGPADEAGFLFTSWTGNSLTVQSIGSINNCDSGGTIEPGYADGSPMIIRIWRPLDNWLYETQVTWSVGSGIFGEAETVISGIELLGGPGCTDPEALNFDPNAEFDDGSCIFANHFTLEISPTGKWHLVVIDTTVTTLETGDEIGLFDTSGLTSFGSCDGVYDDLLVAAGIWTGERLSLSAIGSIDNCAIGGTQIPGYVEGHNIILRLIRAGQVLDTELQFSIGDGIWGVDLLTVIEEIQIIP